MDKSCCCGEDRKKKQWVDNGRNETIQINEHTQNENNTFLVGNILLIYEQVMAERRHGQCC